MIILSVKEQYARTKKAKQPEKDGTAQESSSAEISEGGECEVAGEGFSNEKADAEPEVCGAEEADRENREVEEVGNEEGEIGEIGGQ